MRAEIAPSEDGRRSGATTAARRSGRAARLAGGFAAAALLASAAACSGAGGGSGASGGTTSSSGGTTSSSGGGTSSSGGGTSSSGGETSSSGGGTSSSGGGTTSSSGASGDGAFETCLASLTPLCRTAEMNTAAKLQAACKDTEYLAIPLSGGGTYGPRTIPGGPYGGTLQWNQGKGTAFVNPVNLLEAVCNVGIDSFGEPAAVTGDLKNKRGLDASLYTVFRPACLKDGERYPVITWANGTCGYTHGYAMLLGAIASHGFVVVASNSTYTAIPPTNEVQLRALDYAKALDQDPTSPLHGRLDLDRVGAMGHSQGASATATAAKDPRVKAVIFWNAGTSSDKPFLNVSGDRDVGAPTASSLRSDTDRAAKPGGWIFLHQVLQTGGTYTGHLVLMEQPERVADLAVAWWKWQLKGDEDAKKAFVGDSCGLCGRADELEYGHNALLR